MLNCGGASPAACCPFPSRTSQWLLVRGSGVAGHPMSTSDTALLRGTSSAKPGEGAQPGARCLQTNLGLMRRSHHGGAGAAGLSPRVQMRKGSLGTPSKDPLQRALSREPHTERGWQCMLLIKAFVFVRRKLSPPTGRRRQATI